MFALCLSVTSTELIRSRSIATIKLRIPLPISCLLRRLQSHCLPFSSTVFSFSIEERERERKKWEEGSFPSRRIRSKLDNKGYQDNLTRISRNFYSRIYIYPEIRVSSFPSNLFVSWGIREDVEIDGNILARFSRALPRVEFFD